MKTIFGIKIADFETQKAFGMFITTCKNIETLNKHRKLDLSKKESVESCKLWIITDILETDISVSYRVSDKKKIVHFCQYVKPIKQQIIL